MIIVNPIANEIYLDRGLSLTHTDKFSSLAHYLFPFSSASSDICTLLSVPLFEYYFSPPFPSVVWVMSRDLCALLNRIFEIFRFSKTKDERIPITKKSNKFARFADNGGSIALLQTDLFIDLTICVQFRIGRKCLLT